jgi:hypothetical protein
LAGAAAVFAEEAVALALAAGFFTVDAALGAAYAVEPEADLGDFADF